MSWEIGVIFGLLGGLLMLGMADILARLRTIHKDMQDLRAKIEIIARKASTRIERVEEKVGIDPTPKRRDSDWLTDSNTGDETRI